MREETNLSPRDDSSIRKINPENLPSIDETSELIESILKAVFKDNFSKYVIKQRINRFLVLPPRYLHFPPILITIQSHPENDSKALFVTISRRIPLASDEELSQLLNRIGGFLNIEIEKIRRPYKQKKADDKFFEITYLLLANRIHVFSLKDQAWLLLALSTMIRIDDKLVMEEEAKDFREKEKTHLPTVEYT